MQQNRQSHTAEYGKRNKSLNLVFRLLFKMNIFFLSWNLVK